MHQSHPNRGVQCIKETQNKKRRAMTYVKVRLFHKIIVFCQLYNSKKPSKIKDFSPHSACGLTWLPGRPHETIASFIVGSERVPPTKQARSNYLFIKFCNLHQLFSNQRDIPLHFTLSYQLWNQMPQ